MRACKVFDCRHLDCTPTRCTSPKSSEGHALVGAAAGMEAVEVMPVGIERGTLHLALEDRINLESDPPSN